ncbi:hypothetical protein DXG01_001498 [Tephrocybe rancida]|nr:hypothetical protein DXG01_001498 [Tephrocybe rancida]
MDLILNSPYIERPHLTEKEIDDRSKGDAVAKGLTVLQTTYFLVQCITRMATRLPITELEFITFAYTILNIYVYAMWWKKPQNVDCAFPVYEKRLSGNRKAVFERVMAIREMEESDATMDDGSSRPRIWARAVGRAVKKTLLAPLYAFGAWAVPEQDTGIKAIKMPPFYSYELGQTSSPTHLCATALIATLFGAIHCVSWPINLSFPTPAEQIIWRVSSVCLTAIPPLLLGPTRYTLKRRRSVANSSDTEASSATPPRKRSRRERSGLAPAPDCDLEEILRHRIFDAKDGSAIDNLKNMKSLKRDQDIVYVAQTIIDNIKSAVQEDIREQGRKTLEVELYLRWLEGFDFVLKGIEAVLNAKVPGTRRRFTGLGRLSFSLMYHLIEGFIDEVNAHQDGWSFRYPAGPVEPDPLIMTLAEECTESSSDTRSDDAVRAAEELFKQYDKIMVLALRRYKSECNKKLMASAIDRKEESLSRGCCLLSEQTGYGGTDDMGFNLLVDTRDAMMEWKAEAKLT